MLTTPAAMTDRPSAFRTQPSSQQLVAFLRRRRRLRAEVMQLLTAALAVGLAFLTPHVHVGFDMATSRAIEMLIAVGAGTVTFIGIVFSLLFLVVQFGSTTFTPRLNLFRDAPIVWRAFALYAGVVVYSFTAALVIGREETTSGVVPIVAFIGVIASLVVYRQLQMRAFTFIQLAPTLVQVTRRGREVIDALYCPGPPTEDVVRRTQPTATPRVHGGGREIRWPGRGGIVQVIDVPAVLRAAESARTVIDFHVGPGQTIAEGAVLASTDGSAGPGLASQIVHAVTVGEERTFEQDPALALRVLADIALRALSPAINDPTTAVQALDAIEGLLRVLATRQLDIGNLPASDGVARVRLALPSWDDFLSIALDDIVALPALLPSVRLRTERLLDDIKAVAPPDRRPSLEAHRRQLLQGR